MRTTELHSDIDQSADTDALLAELRREARLSRKLSKVGWVFHVASLFSMISWQLCYHLLGRHHPLLDAILPVFCLSVLASYLCCIILLVQRFRRKRRSRLIQNLSADVRAVGALALLQHWKQDSKITSQVRDTLIVLLPYLKSQDAQYLTAEQQMILAGLLTSRDSTLVLAVLKGLAQVGDKHAIAPVQRLTTDQNPQIREAAQECLFLLQARVDEQEHAMTLLRPSDAMSATQETLLRPAAAGDIGKGKEQLLRPVE